MQDEGVLAHIIVDANKGDISCGAPIAIVVDDDAEYAEFLKLSPEVYVTTSSSSDAPAAATSPATTEAAPASSGRGAPLRMSPAARHMIASQGLAMEGILGTAKRGAVLSKEDVINAVKSGAAKPKPKAATSSAPQPASQIVTSSTATASASRAATDSPSAVMSSGDVDTNNYTDIPNANMRKIIAKRLTQSKQTVPHYYTTMECELDAMLTLRKELKSDFGVNVSVNDMVIKAAALALRDVPEANGKWNSSNNTRQMSDSVDISVAVATPNGLITPIVTAAHTLGLASINSKV